MTTGREWFTLAGQGFLELAGRVDPGVLGDPGLGEWDVRSLLGHGCRAFVTIEGYLSEQDGEPELQSVEDYFAAIRSGRIDPAQVAERGRQAGAALGEDPVAEARSTGERVMALVASTPGSRLLSTPLGSMTLDGYLPTRAFELTVHGIDLARAVGEPIPDALQAAAVPAIELVARIAAEQRSEILMALTGRARLHDGFTVL